MTDISYLVTQRVENWKTDLKSPIINIDKKQDIQPDIDRSILSERFPPSNKVPIGRRYKLQDAMYKSYKSLITNDEFVKTEKSYKEKEIFEEAKDAVSYDSTCIKELNFLKAQEQILKKINQK